MKGRLFVGTSGYSYRHWGGGMFYPQDLPQNKWLEYYAKFFDTVELNVSFYRLPQEATFKGWYRRTPKDFTFALKGSRFITHVKKLQDCEEALRLFLSRAKLLQEKLSIVLWQLMPSFQVDESRLERFCRLLKEESADLKFQNVFEFRNKSWFCENVYDILKFYGISLCIAHSNRYPSACVITANPVYLRFHGGTVLYGSNYSDEELKYWADKAKEWLEEGKCVYAYFNNDFKCFAVQNALKLKELISLTS